MAKVVIDTSGFARVLAQEPQRVAVWLDGFAETIVTDVKLSFGTSPAGRVYGVHTASAEGYPPNVDTGALRASIRWEREGSLTRLIMDGVEYGIYLEDGRTDMLPRPFMQPAFDRAQRRVEADARQNLRLE